MDIQPLEELLKDCDFSKLQSYAQSLKKRKCLVPASHITKISLLTLRSILADEKHSMFDRVSAVSYCLLHFSRNREPKEPWIELSPLVSSLLLTCFKRMFQDASETDDITLSSVMNRLFSIIDNMSPLGHPVSSNLFNDLGEILLTACLRVTTPVRTRLAILLAVASLLNTTEYKAVYKTMRKIPVVLRLLPTWLNRYKDKTETLINIYTILVKALPDKETANERAKLWFNGNQRLQNIFVEAYSMEFSKGSGYFINFLLYPETMPDAGKTKPVPISDESWKSPLGLTIKRKLESDFFKSPDKSESESIQQTTSEAAQHLKNEKSSPTFKELEILETRTNVQLEATPGSKRKKLSLPKNQPTVQVDYTSARPAVKSKSTESSNFNGFGRTQQCQKFDFRTVARSSQPLRKKRSQHEDIVDEGVFAAGLPKACCFLDDMLPRAKKTSPIFTQQESTPVANFPYCLENMPSVKKSPPKSGADPKFPFCNESVVPKKKSYIQKCNPIFNSPRKDTIIMNEEIKDCLVPSPLQIETEKMENVHTGSYNDKKWLKMKNSLPPVNYAIHQRVVLWIKDCMRFKSSHPYPADGEVKQIDEEVAENLKKQNIPKNIHEKNKKEFQKILFDKEVNPYKLKNNEGLSKKKNGSFSSSHWAKKVTQLINRNEAEGSSSNHDVYHFNERSMMRGNYLNSKQRAKTRKEKMPKNKLPKDEKVAKGKNRNAKVKEKENQEPSTKLKSEDDAVVEIDLDRPDEDSTAESKKIVDDQDKNSCRSVSYSPLVRSPLFVDHGDSPKSRHPSPPKSPHKSGSKDDTCPKTPLPYQDVDSGVDLNSPSAGSVASPVSDIMGFGSNHIEEFIARVCETYDTSQNELARGQGALEHDVNRMVALSLELQNTATRCLEKNDAVKNASRNQHAKITQMLKQRQSS